MRDKTGMKTGGNKTAHTHTCMARGNTVGEDVLSLLYQVLAGLHFVGLNFAVPSTDQHLEGGHGRGRERATVYTDTKLANR